MPAPLSICLSPAQEAELKHVRDHAPNPSIRERAAAILQVASGASVRAARPTPLIVLPRPASAPWTTPGEDPWRAWLGDVIHHHGFGADWARFQAAGAVWLAGWAEGSSHLRPVAGLCPHQ